MPVIPPPTYPSEGDLIDPALINDLYQRYRTLHGQADEDNLDGNVRESWLRQEDFKQRATVASTAPFDVLAVEGVEVQKIVIPGLTWSGYIRDTTTAIRVSWNLIAATDQTINTSPVESLVPFYRRPGGDIVQMLDLKQPLPGSLEMLASVRYARMDTMYNGHFTLTGVVVAGHPGWWDFGVRLHKEGGLTHTRIRVRSITVRQIA